MFNSAKQKLLAACESLQLRPVKRWQSLPHMQFARSNFNPCLYQAIIYLCGFGSNEVEAFNPQQKRYSPLNLQIPESTACCIYPSCGLLVIHSTQYVSRYRLNAEGTLEELPRAPRQGNCMKYQHSQPVAAMESGVVWCAWDKRCWGFSMKTGERISKA